MGVGPYYYQAYGLAIAAEISLPPLETGPPTPADLTIRSGRLPESPPVAPTKIHRAGLNARFAQQGSNQLWLDWSPLVSFMALNGNELVVDTTHTDADLIALFTLSEALGLILFQKNYFLLHGSAVRVGDEGVVFLGEPGAGKSTTAAAFAQKGCPLLSDDMVCIQQDESGNHRLIPAFSQIKLWKSSVDGLQLAGERLAPVREGVNKFSWQASRAFTADAVPLKRIFVLTPPSESGCVVAPLPASQVPVELLRHFPLADALLTGLPLKEYFEKSVAIAQTTPVCRMSRPVDFTALDAFVAQLTSTAHRERSLS